MTGEIGMALVDGKPCMMSRFVQWGRPFNKILIVFKDWEEAVEVSEFMLGYAKEMATPLEVDEVVQSVEEMFKEFSGGH